MSSPSDQLPSIALTALKIRDFRGIVNLDLDFRGPDGSPNRLVVLGGPNGCGKTSVLEAAILVLDDTDLILRGIGSTDVRRGAEHAWIEGEVHDPKAPNPSTVRRISTRQSPPQTESSYLPLWYFPSWRTPGLGGPVDVSMGEPKSYLRKDQATRLRDIKRKLVTAAAVEKFRSNGSRANPQYSRWMEAINLAWNEFDDSKQGSINVELTDNAHPDRLPFDLYYHHPDRPRLEVDHFSSGQLELFIFIAEFVFDSDRVGIVFIDEPELHLDPQWHRPFLRSLMRIQPKTQFIVTTHSPEIFDSAYSYERHFLVSEEDPRAQLWARNRPETLEV